MYAICSIYRDVSEHWHFYIEISSLDLLVEILTGVPEIEIELKWWLIL